MWVDVQCTTFYRAVRIWAHGRLEAAWLARYETASTWTHATRRPVSHLQWVTSGAPCFAREARTDREVANAVATGQFAVLQTPRCQPIAQGNHKVTPLHRWTTQLDESQQ